MCCECAVNVPLFLSLKLICTGVLPSREVFLALKLTLPFFLRHVTPFPPLRTRAGGGIFATPPPKITSSFSLNLEYKTRFSNTVTTCALLRLLLKSPAGVSCVSFRQSLPALNISLRGVLLVDSAPPHLFRYISFVLYSVHLSLIYLLSRFSTRVITNTQRLTQQRTRLGFKLPNSFSFNDSCALSSPTVACLSPLLFYPSAITSTQHLTSQYSHLDCELLNLIISLSVLCFTLYASHPPRLLADLKSVFSNGALTITPKHLFISHVL